MMYDCRNCKIARQYGCNRVEYGCSVKVILNAGGRTNRKKFNLNNYFYMPGDKRYRGPEEE